jgi:hypothetical protein
MVQGKYRVTLTDEECEGLERRVRSGRASARLLTRARILLKADAGEEDAVIAQALDGGLSTLPRVRQRFVEDGVEAAIVSRQPRRVYARALDGEQEAHLIALACGQPPQGQARWTLRLLAGRRVELGHVEALSHETGRTTLKKTLSSQG